MILGIMKDGLPWMEINVSSLDGSRSIEFVVDTGFDGDLAMPGRMLHRLPVRRFTDSMRQLADGTLREFPTYLLSLRWGGEERLVEIVAMEGNPLIGTGFLDGCRLCVDLNEGGEVDIEMPS